MKTVLMLSGLIFLCAGCTTHRFGDARIRNNYDFAGISVDRFYLKSVPIDRAGTNILRVRNLPLAMYPTHLMLRITPNEAELKQELPWENAKLRIEFRAPNGQNFFSKELALIDAQRGSSPGTFH